MGIIEQYEMWESGLGKNHQGHAFPSDILKKIEEFLPNGLECTAETGCGKSTILFSNISKKHFVFALDDRADGFNSSVNFYRDCPLTKSQGLIEVFGPTQITLPKYSHECLYDCVLIDGPHGFPFPEMEYFYFYPKIKQGGYLILDDVNIPSIGRMADILCKDDMWHFVKLIGCTAIFQRTNALMTNPLGDEWWTQKYNRRRVSIKRDIHISEGAVVDQITSLRLDMKLHGE